MAHNDMPQNVAEAYQHCLKTARQHYENFPTASWFIRRDLRPAVAAIYAFARHADDLADEGMATPEKRLKQLDAWETLLERCVDAPEHPIFIALNDTIRRHNLSLDPFFDLLVAFRMDVTIHTYASAEELMFYCRHSANPVGRLMLALHGINKAEAISASDAICSGLQLANFWQDLSIDLPRGRCYLPADWLEAAALSPTSLMEKSPDQAQLQPALSEAIAYTRRLFDQGQGLLQYLPFRLRLQIAATLHGGRRILQAVEQEPNLLGCRPTLGKADWLRMAGGILWDSLLPPKSKES